MEIKRVNDYYEKVKEKFPDLTQKEVEDILTYGFKAFYLINLYGADVLLKSWNYTMYIGHMFRDIKKFWEYWHFKSTLKLRIKYKRKKPIYDGYYYFGLSEDDYKKYGLDKKHGRKSVTFDHLILYKIKEEAFLYKNSKYFYKIAIKEDCGFTQDLTNFKTNQFSLIAKRDSDFKINLI